MRGAAEGCALLSPSAVFSTEPSPSVAGLCGLKIGESGFGAFIFLFHFPKAACRHE